MVSKSESVDSIVRRMIEHDFVVPELDVQKPEPTKLAALAFWGLMSGLVLAAEARLFDEDDSSLLLGVIQRLPEVRGYMRAIADTQSLLAGKGATARRLIGDAKRLKVRTVAQEFRGRMPKEQAAELVAKRVGLARSTVLRMLTKMFPEPHWSGPGG